MVQPLRIPFRILEHRYRSGSLPEFSAFAGVRYDCAVAGVTLGGLLLGEPVASRGVLLGLPLVVAGIVVVNWRSRPRAA